MQFIHHNGLHHNGLHLNGLRHNHITILHITQTSLHSETIANTRHTEQLKVSAFPVHLPGQHILSHLNSPVNPFIKIDLIRERQPEVEAFKLTKEMFMDGLNHFQFRGSSILIVHQSLVGSIFMEFHNQQNNQSIHKSTQLIARFWSPKLFSEIKRHTRSCAVCQPKQSNHISFFTSPHSSTPQMTDNTKTRSTSEHFHSSRAPLQINPGGLKHILPLKHIQSPIPSNSQNYFHQNFSNFP